MLTHNGYVFQDYYDDAAKWWDRSRQLNPLPHSPMPKVTEMANGIKEIETPGLYPRKNLVVQNETEIKTYHVQDGLGDSGAHPFGPYDILMPERLESFITS